MSSVPAVVIKSKFIIGGAAGKANNFNQYLNYMDRPNTHTHENGFETYQDYMSNEEKSTGLFTMDKVHLSEEEKQQYKELFKYSQSKGSLLWQDVISFDNEWLKEMKVLKDNGIDDKKLQQATRNAVNEMLKKEGMVDSAVWTAAIHYNTDNIHVHIAIVQTKDFRQRGKRKQKSIDTMKSKVVNTIMDRSKENERLNDFIRKKVIGSKRNDDLMSLKNRIINRDMVNQFKKIHSMLPEDKRLWQYNMNGIANVRQEIDKLTTMYIERNFKNEFKDFKNQLDKEVNLYKKTYGNSEKAERYRENKMKDLYTRMGNTVLKEVKEYDKKLNAPVTKKTNDRTSAFKAKRDLNKIMFMMNRHMNDDIQSFKNQRAYEQLQREQEMGR